MVTQDHPHRSCVSVLCEWRLRLHCPTMSPQSQPWPGGGPRGTAGPWPVRCRRAAPTEGLAAGGPGSALGRPCRAPTRRCRSPPHPGAAQRRRRANARDPLLLLPLRRSSPGQVRVKSGSSLGQVRIKSGSSPVQVRVNSGSIPGSVSVAPKKKNTQCERRQAEGWGGGRRRPATGWPCSSAMISCASCSTSREVLARNSSSPLPAAAGTAAGAGGTRGCDWARTER